MIFDKILSSLKSVNLPPNKDLRDPNQKEPQYTGPKLRVKAVILTDKPAFNE